jgi:cullin-4
MRRGQGSGTEAEFDRQLEEIIALIGFTPDKDVFKAFYSTQLAKRLLLNKSASDDMERNMIIKLQQGKHAPFTGRSCPLIIRNGRGVYVWRYHDEGPAVVGNVSLPVPRLLKLMISLVRSYQTARSKNPDGYKDPGNLTANVLTESAWPAYACFTFHRRS